MSARPPRKSSLQGAATGAARPLAGVTGAATLAWDPAGSIRGVAGDPLRVLGKSATDLRGRRLAQIFERADALDEAAEFALTRSMRLLDGPVVQVEAGPCPGGAVALVRSRGNRELEVTEVMSSLGHELRNAFGSVLLAVQSLIRQESGLSERGLRRLQVADRELRRIEAVLRGLAEIGRARISRPVSAVPEELLAEAAAALGPEMAARLVWPVGEGPPALLDAPRVRLAVEELLRHAVRASPGGSRVELYVERRKGALALGVRAPARVERRPEIELGLAVVEGVARAHGGHLEHDRSPGGDSLALVLPQRAGRP